MTEIKYTDSVYPKQLKDNLESLKKELIERVEFTQDDRKPVELDQSQIGRLSRMDAIQLQEMALEQERRREIELRKIDAALVRLEEGEYGICRKCRQDILLKRLEFDPSTPLCINCADG